MEQYLNQDFWQLFVKVYFAKMMLLLVQYWWYSLESTTIRKIVKSWSNYLNFNTPTQLLWYESLSNPSLSLEKFYESVGYQKDTIYYYY